MHQSISLEELRLLLRLLGKFHPAPHLDAKVMGMYRAWVRGQGKKDRSARGSSKPESSYYWAKGPLLCLSALRITVTSLKVLQLDTCSHQE